MQRTSDRSHEDREFYRWAAGRLRRMSQDGFEGHQRGAERDQLKCEIAAAAARLIAVDGTDYATAKRKAVQAVLGTGANARGLVPDNAQVEDELRRYLGTFMGGRQVAVLGALRVQALQLMQRLDAFRPRLVGAVLNGTATEHSDLHLHLFADSPKDVEMFLLNEGVDFDVTEGGREGDGALETLHFVVQPARARGAPTRLGVVLDVHEVDAIRVAPRYRSSHPDLHPVEASGRADEAQLRALLRDRHPDLGV